MVELTHVNSTKIGKNRNHKIIIVLENVYEIPEMISFIVFILHCNAFLSFLLLKITLSLSLNYSVIISNTFVVFYETRCRYSEFVSILYIVGKYINVGKISNNYLSVKNCTEFNHFID